MKIKFAETASGDTLAVPAYSRTTLSDPATALDEKTGGAISRAIKASRFKGEAGDVVEIVSPNGVDAARIVVFGLGESKDADGNVFEKAGASVVKHLLNTGADTVSFHLDGVTDTESAARTALGATMAAYRFDAYRTKLKADKKPSLKTAEFVVSDEKAAKKSWKSWEAVADGVKTARDLVMEPANILYPTAYTKRVKEKLEKLGVEIEVLGEKEMEKLGMGALLGVGQGSVRESQLVIMRWNGGKDGEKPLAFVGKGVCFDTGGISLKPGLGMEEMKGDMGGSAAVVGLMHALAGRKANVNAIGVIGLVENMPDGNAQRPGDIVTSLSGQTIEILNTDAEGRLVLADALWYTQERFDPRFIIDLATLTGAILITLGHEHAGVFSNDDELVDNLTRAGKASDETVWRLPIGAEYDRQIDSTVADMKNLGEGRNAGSIAAAVFLQRFVNEKPWVHIDIAGTGMQTGSKDPRKPSFGTGYGVRLLDRLVRDYYEG
ncbi:putative cytosol aminopeptidase [Marinicauda pacifica]|jgi:leucyl aminopeptidase|uniref:Probable cytosol aminopeptidase n=1 Tax=Marinicauda pacifica TaxID=1133559 RepID=A0A4S2HGE6_9PROT|nr:leucyl aminopeptidase [Marinicauda pacifica]TGY94702.1 leucyl aminopeptidase [Marinicauda pacifica]GGE38047.1 putative cytosol aminopeptidase [Marinicauda pacifica]